MNKCSFMCVRNMTAYVQGFRRRWLKGPVLLNVLTLCVLIFFCIFWANKYMMGINIYVKGCGTGTRDCQPYVSVTKDTLTLKHIQTVGTTEDKTLVKYNTRKQHLNKLPLEKQPPREIKEETKTDVVYAKQKVKEPKRGHIESPQGKEATENLDQRDHQDIKYHGIDLMMLPKYTFDPAYKNPCWNENGTLRCLPYFFLLGVKKSGTTALWKQISSHPDFAFQTLRKEQQWFAVLRFNKSANWLGNYWDDSLPRDNFDAYIDLFQRAATLIDSKENRTNNKCPRCHMITGDGSTTYLHLNSHWRYLPGNENCDEPKYVILDYIHHFLPRAKIIIIFRDPVERLYSEYYHEFGRLRRNFNSSPEHFHEVVVSGLNMYKDCLKTRTLRSCVYDERIYDKTVISIQLGIYCVYWQELFRIFPRKQILALQHTELLHTARVQNKIFEFLDMDNLPPSLRAKDQVIYQRRPEDASKGPMMNETRALLYNFYRPFNEEMSRLYGDPVFLYKQTI